MSIHSIPFAFDFWCRRGLPVRLRLSELDCCVQHGSCVLAPHVYSGGFFLGCERYYVLDGVPRHMEGRVSHRRG